MCFITRTKDAAAIEESLNSERGHARLLHLRDFPGGLIDDSWEPFKQGLELNCDQIVVRKAG